MARMEHEQSSAQLADALVELLPEPERTVMHELSREFSVEGVESLAEREGMEVGEVVELEQLGEAMLAHPAVLTKARGL